MTYLSTAPCSAAILVCIICSTPEHLRKGERGSLQTFNNCNMRDNMHLWREQVWRSDYRRIPDEITSTKNSVIRFSFTIRDGHIYSLCAKYITYLHKSCNDTACHIEILFLPMLSLRPLQEKVQSHYQLETMKTLYHSTTLWWLHCIFFA